MIDQCMQRSFMGSPRVTLASQLIRLHDTDNVAVARSAIASALTAPASGDPSGNPFIHPGLNELIPAGTTYAITWTPTTQGEFIFARPNLRTWFD